MSKKLVVVLIIALGLIGFITVSKIQSKKDFDQKMALARETHKAVNRLMFDLREADEASIQGVAADGAWHEAVSFKKSKEGTIAYSLDQGHLQRRVKDNIENVADNISIFRLRRLEQTPSIIEVQLQAKRSLSLTTNFKIRFRS